jgi:hypothetical protein
MSDVANCGACGNACANGQSCRAGSCTSESCNGQPCALTCCGGTSCVDTQRDPDNCGLCGRRCNRDLGEQCVAQAGSLSSCQVVCGGEACLQGESCCQDACTDLQNDSFNCGRCGHACSDVEFCIFGCCDDGSGRCEGDGGVPDAGQMGDGGVPDGGVGDGSARDASFMDRLPLPDAAAAGP